MGPAVVHRCKGAVTLLPGSVPDLWECGRWRGEEEGGIWRWSTEPESGGQTWSRGGGATGIPNMTVVRSSLTVWVRQATASHILRAEERGMEERDMKKEGNLAGDAKGEETANCGLEEVS